MFDLVNVGAATVSVLAAVGSAWMFVKSASRSVRRDVDDLIETVDRVARRARSEQMRRVRSAPSVLGAGDPEAAGAPPELQQVLPLDAAAAKAELRKRLLRGVR